MGVYYVPSFWFGLLLGKKMKGDCNVTSMVKNIMMEDIKKILCAR
jgi:hypothetical protein